MDLTPEVLRDARFAGAKRGYDMAAVDAFLDQAADGLDALMARLTAEFERAQSASARVEELEAELRALDERLEAAVSLTTDAESGDPDQEAAEPSTVQDAMAVLVHAQTTADQTLSEAREEAARIRAEAEAEHSARAKDLEAEAVEARAQAQAAARRAGEEARQQMNLELANLRRSRDGLSEEVRTLRRWVDDQRSRVRGAVRDLQRVLEDPTALRDIPAPATAEFETQEPDQPTDDERGGKRGTDEAPEAAASADFGPASAEPIPMGPSGVEPDAPDLGGSEASTDDEFYDPFSPDEDQIFAEIDDLEYEGSERT